MAVPAEFPVLPCLESCVPEPVWETVTRTSRAGIEVRRTQQVGARYRWTLTYSAVRTNVLAPAPWGAWNEMEAISALYDASKGSLSTFSFIDPVTGVAYAVRFDDPPEFSPKAGLVWFTAKVKLISVL